MDYEAFLLDVILPLFLFALPIVICVCISDLIIYIFQKIHCHKIMKKGEYHRCKYWTCPHHSYCPYNDLERFCSKFLNNKKNNKF